MAADQPQIPIQVAQAPAPAEDASNPKSYWTLWHTLAIPALLIATGLIGLFFLSSFHLLTWTAMLIVLVLLSLTIGHGITNKWDGLLIDERNKISLSRFQMVLWIIIILSAFLSVAFINMRTNPLTALTFDVPAELWALIGISTTSLIGSPLALSTKGEKVTINTTNHQARWADMFMGEEIANQGQLDVGKVQMFYFTIILAVAYVGALTLMFLKSSSTINSFPALNDGLITLLGISHAGYLINKTVPRVGTTSSDQSPV